MIVKEDIDFKRGQSSKEALDVGQYRKIYPSINWENTPTGAYLMKDIDNAYGLLYWDKDKEDAKISDIAKTSTKALSLPLREGVPLDYLKDFDDLLLWIKKVKTPQHLIDKGYPG